MNDTILNNPLTLNCKIAESLLCGFIENAVCKVGFRRVILGLSGGVDSALSAALAAKALGSENVFPIIMPYEHSNVSSKTDAELVCQIFNLRPQVVDITDQIDAYFMNHVDANKTRRGNKMSRERMSILYDYSAANNALVLGTSNKTELLLGYGSIFGDMASAINPLGDLYKTQVFQLAGYMEVPKSILHKVPTADLWEGQSDEQELGFDYTTADKILHYLIDKRYSIDEIVLLGFELELVQRIASLVQNSQYKRRPPIIAKLSERTIEREFRYPRDWKK